METNIKPTVGRIVYYKLSAQDVEETNRRRQDFVDNSMEGWCKGAQAHFGHHVHEGDVYPMIIVNTLQDEGFINGKVFLDGNDTLWVRGITQGQEGGQWDWMPFQKDQQARLGGFGIGAEPTNGPVEEAEE